MSMTIDKSKLEAIRAKLPELRDRRHSENSVQTVDVTRQFQLGENVIHALRGVDLTVKRGEYTSLMGPSGTGKTTLFNMIGGLDKPTAGKGAALRQAQLDLLYGNRKALADVDWRGNVRIQAKDTPEIPFVHDEMKPFAHPHYWAPFILVGNFK